MPEIGQNPSHYSLAEKTGKSRMRVVYKIRDPRQHRFVALNPFSCSAIEFHTTRAVSKQGKDL